MRFALLLFLVSCAPVSAQTFTERFDTTPDGAIPAGWTRFQLGAAPESVWGVRTLSGQGQSAAESDFGAQGSGQSALVTPPLTPAAGDVLRFRAAELTIVPTTTRLEVRAGPGGGTGPTAFPFVLGTIEATELPRPVVAFGLVQIDLSPIAGQNLRIAFVHVNTIGSLSGVGGALYLDDVLVGPAPSGPLLTVAREPEAFGIVGIGRSRDTRARIDNDGGTALTLGEPVVQGDTDWITVEAPAAGTVLPVGGTAEVRFSFAPSAAGSASVTVTIPSDGGAVTLTTTGTGGQISEVTGTTVGGTEWNPPRINGIVCETAPATGVFATTDVSVSASGRYRFAGQLDLPGGPVSVPRFGAFALYDGPFDPSEPCVGTVLVLGPTLRVSGEVDLTAGVPYRLAASTYTGFGSTSPGPFVAELVGPGTVAFSTAEAPEPNASALSIDVLGANPSRGRVAVAVRAPGAARVEMFDVLGRRVAVLFDGLLGTEARTLSAPDVPPGVYTIRLTTDRAQATRRVTVVR